MTLVCQSQRTSFARLYLESLCSSSPRTNNIVHKTIQDARKTDFKTNNKTQTTVNVTKATSLARSNKAPTMTIKRKADGAKSSHPIKIIAATRF